jgi:hypothetical protein
VLYALDAWIGGGSNADVWRAVGPSGHVAVKLLRSKNPAAEPYQRFVREVEQLRLLGDVPGVLPILDAHLPTQGADEPRAWLVMPLAQPLRDALGADATAEAVVEAVVQVAETLAALGLRGIAHRDVKPENLYERDGRAEIGDFGLVDAPDVEALTLPNEGLGPAHFLAPEMIQDALSADGRAADVYSLGKVLWVLLTRQRFPPPGEHRLDEPTMCVRSYLSHPRVASLDTLIARMTRHNPNERPDMAGCAVELNAWLSGAGEVSSPRGSFEALARRLAQAAGPVRSEEAALARRVEEVDAALDSFAASAADVVDVLSRDGVPVFHRPGRWGHFCTDATDHLVEATGLLSTTKMLGRKPPASRAVGAILQAEAKLPGLKLWIAIADIPPAPEAVFACGAALTYWGGHTQSLWHETRTAVLNGPAMPVAISELVGQLASRVGDDVAEWVKAVERAASHGD